MLLKNIHNVKFRRTRKHLKRNVFRHFDIL